jgi:hypothetical protein
MILLGLLLIVAAACVFAFARFPRAHTVALVLLCLGAALVLIDALDISALTFDD